jgi:hypothetical protein
MYSRSSGNQVKFHGRPLFQEPLVRFPFTVPSSTFPSTINLPAPESRCQRVVELFRCRKVEDGLDALTQGGCARGR